MKRKKFIKEQIIKALKWIDADQKSKEVCREPRVHQETYYNCKKYSILEGDQFRHFEVLPKKILSKK